MLLSGNEGSDFNVDIYAWVFFDYIESGNMMALLSIPKNYSFISKLILISLYHVHLNKQKRNLSILAILGLNVQMTVSNQGKQLRDLNMLNFLA